MKKLIQINSICKRSTGNIMESIASYARENNYEVYNYFRDGKPVNEQYDKCFENKIELYLHVLMARLGLNGYGSYFSTKKLVRELKKQNPDVIQIHNIHGYYINLKVLFKYLKNDFKGQIFWTMHDCWSFTGHCSYFSQIGCNKWQHQCKNCPQIKRYPKEYVDSSKNEYNYKKKTFTNVKNLHIITPSKWLKSMIEESFLNEYDVNVINNGIDLKKFKQYKAEELEEVYEKYNISKNKQVLLGAAIGLDKDKGLYDHLEVCNRLNDNQILVLVGINPNDLEDIKTKITDMSKVILLPRTTQEELVKLYNIATFYLNLSTEETFGMTTIEAMAVGTPVIAYNKTAVPECITEKTGVVIKDYDNRIDRIIEIINNPPKFDKNIISSEAKNYTKEIQSKKYIDLYNKYTKESR